MNKKNLFSENIVCVCVSAKMKKKANAALNINNKIQEMKD